MSLRIDLEAKDDNAEVMLPSVGCEVEMRPIRILTKDGDKLIYVGEKVLKIFKARHGVTCEDDLARDSRFPIEVQKIAIEEKFSFNKNDKNPQILEFVTEPVTHIAYLDNQFQEITRLQTNLIETLLTKQDFRTNLVSIKDWLKQFSDEEITIGEMTDKLFIMLDYSIKKLKLTDEQLQNKDKKQVAEEVQKKLKQYVQFNFVAGLGKKMGSMLVDIYESNNKASKDKISLENCLHQLEELEKSPSATAAKLRALEGKIEGYKARIASREKQKDILLEAEHNAEIACAFIRSEFLKTESKIEGQSLLKNPTHRKLSKLEGLFFILSMRILTETNYAGLKDTTSSKNKYLFFLKTQLSDLVRSLSLNDKLLLNEIHTWDVAKKNHLYALIAGSYYALNVSYKLENGNEYTVKDVIESALFGYRDDYLPLCNSFPGASVKSFETPYEPKSEALRSKEQNFQRVLFEYRGSERKTIAESLEEMKNIFRAATKFCKTTQLLKQEFSHFDHQSVADSLKSKVTLKEKADFLRQLKLYNPDCYISVKDTLPEINDIEYKQKKLDEASHVYYQSSIVDDSVSRALGFILSPDELNLKNKLREILFHEDSDITLKQLNYLHEILVNNYADHVQIKANNIRNIVGQLYAEKIFNMFKFPSTEIDQRYISYIEKTYEITALLPNVTDFFNFLKVFSATFPDNFITNLKVRNGIVLVDYSVLVQTPEIGSEMMEYACINRLDMIIHELLKKGVDSNECFYRFFKSGHESYIPKLVEIFGEQALNVAIDKYASKRPHIAASLQAIKNELEQPSATRITLGLSHSVTFVAQENKQQPIAPTVNSRANPKKAFTKAT